MAQYDFQEWLKSLEGRSSAEMLHEGIRASGEAILSLSTLNKGETERASQFAKEVGEFLFWLRNNGGLKPENVRPDNWQPYEKIAQSLVDRGEFTPDVLRPWIV